MYYTNVVHVVVELPHFDASAKAAGLSDDERCRLVDHLAKHPATGDLIPGTGGARKVRLAGLAEDYRREVMRYVRSR